MSYLSRHPDEARALKALFDEGVLEAEEYRAQKERLLKAVRTPPASAHANAPPDARAFLHGSDEDVRETGALEPPRPTPLFQMTPSLLHEEDRAALAQYAATSLGDDPSSKHFMPRKKSIAFCIWIDDNVYCLQHDYFLQPEQYNDFSGGYKRLYDTLPDSLVQGHMREVTRQFVEKYNLPNYSCILLQLQSSTVIAGSQAVGQPQSITGQGVHTDGHDCAMLVCVERTNVSGADNSLYEDLEGKRTLFPPTKLDEGDALFFKDNSLYHHVSDAMPLEPARDMTRTI